MININLSTKSKTNQTIVCLSHKGILSSKLYSSKPLQKIAQSFKENTEKNMYNFVLEKETRIFVFNEEQKLGIDNDDQIRCNAFEISEHFQNSTEKSIAIALDSWSLTNIQAFIQGLYYSNYQFIKYKSKPKIKDLSIDLIIHQNHKKSTKSILNDNHILFDNITLCRDWINTPGSDLTPEIFAKEAQKHCKKTSIHVKLRKMAQLQKEGFQGLVTVGKGSPNNPCMLTLTYTGKSNKQEAPIALVGKGVTFDTGGISLKPGDSMWEMKSDMSGAATVLSTILTISQLKLPINVTAILCLAENRPDGKAILPGDIFKAKNGKTVMVDNTDAEGRLVLSDGLAEAGLVKASHIIDLATLTGSIVRALGPSIAGLFSNDDFFSSQIQDSGKNVGEKFWKMPLEMEYQEQLKDSVADLKNIGSINAGSITAALFLNEFVPTKTKWAHIDIAGTAFISKKWKYHHGNLATGWGVRSLVHLLSNTSFS